MTPLPVTVVRPKTDWGDALGALVVNVVGYAIAAWIVTALTPAVIDWHPSYWRSLAAVGIVRALVGSAQGEHHLWTKAAGR